MSRFPIKELKPSLVKGFTVDNRMGRIIMHLGNAYYNLDIALPRGCDNEIGILLDKIRKQHDDQS